jgi:hypothetical protein
MKNALASLNEMLRVPSSYGNSTVSFWWDGLLMAKSPKEGVFLSISRVGVHLIILWMVLVVMKEAYHQTVRFPPTCGHLAVFAPFPKS